MRRLFATAEDQVSDALMSRRIWQLSLFACGTLLVLSLLLAWSVERTRQANDWVEHTLTVQRELSGYSRDLVDAETGQRGYLLTGSEADLAPYNRVVADNPARLAQLAQLIVDDGARGELQKLAGIFQKKLAELAQTIALARTGKLPAALGIVRQGTGRTLMVQFRRVANQIGDRESALLASRQAGAASGDRNIQIGIAIGATLAILLILFATERTVWRIEDRARHMMQAIAAMTAGRLDQRVQSDSSDGIGKVAQAFNDMADKMLASREAQAGAEAGLATANRQLLAEVGQRAAAQARLFRSVAELKRSNEELDNFAYSASHDLKAPLRGIRNLAEWIAADIGPGAGGDALENLALLNSRVDRLDLLLESLLQYSRVGRAGAAPEDVDIAVLVREIATYLAPRDGLTVTYRGPVPALRTDKAPLEQVLRNLISNGLKHHDRTAGGVVVSAADLGDCIEFRVEDDGPGIAATYHERIFQMFQTLRSRDEVEGSGMGLAIVKKSVEGHGGKIRVESVPPARGTTFVFTWMKDGRQELAA